MATTIKKIKEYDTIIRKHIDKKDCVQVNRSFKDKEDKLTGFILDMGSGFITLQVVDDFLFDGYAVIPKDQFDSLRSNKFERTYKRILMKEGTLKSSFGLNEKIDLTTWQTIFTSLKKNDYHVVIECENLDEPLFTIGPVKHITKNQVSVQYYDPTGLLENKLTKVKFQAITIVKFGDRYSTTFKKYLKTQID